MPSPPVPPRTGCAGERQPLMIGSRSGRGRTARVSTEAIDPVMEAAQKSSWRLDTANGSMAPRSALDVLVDLNEKVSTGRVGEYQPVPLGFTPMDKTIGMGLRAGELLLIGGAQGTGKTTMALQMGRNVASGGQANVLYLCFEHDEQYLLNRLIAMESALAHLPHKTGAIKIQDVRKHSLSGSSAINYEADIILIMNEKYNIVAKVNIEFNPYQAQRFRDWVIVSVEKNRGGQDNVDLEFEKHFEFSCFDPNGRTVQEKLIEERL